MPVRRDLAEVDAARRRLQDGLVPLEPDARFSGALGEHERLLAWRAGVVLQVIGGAGASDRAAGQPGQAGAAGDLLVTTERLVHVGGLGSIDGLGGITGVVAAPEEGASVPPHVGVDLPLARIREAIATTGLLLLLLDDGTGIAVRVPDPLVLRVELAAARRNARDQPSGVASSR